jgi:hypothetical protein
VVVVVGVSAAVVLLTIVGVAVALVIAAISDGDVPVEARVTSCQIRDTPRPSIRATVEVLASEPTSNTYWLYVQTNVAFVPVPADGHGFLVVPTKIDNVSAVSPTVVQVESYPSSEGLRWPAHGACTAWVESAECWSCGVAFIRSASA